MQVDYRKGRMPCLVSIGNAVFFVKLTRAVQWNHAMGIIGWAYAGPPEINSIILTSLTFSPLNLHNTRKCYLEQYMNDHQNL